MLQQLPYIITSCKLDGMCKQMNADEKFDSFKSSLVIIYNDSFPYVTRKTKPLNRSKPHINAKLRESFKEKHRFEKKFKYHCITYGDLYRNLSYRVHKLTAKAKKIYFSGKMVQVIKRPKLNWNISVDTLGRKRI